jgi:hypothetical protein
MHYHAVYMATYTTWGLLVFKMFNPPGMRASREGLLLLYLQVPKDRSRPAFACSRSSGQHPTFNTYSRQMIVTWLLQTPLNAHALCSCRCVQMNLLGDLQMSNNAVWCGCRSSDILVE